MNKQYNELINAIFYQYLEYIVAPLVLVLLTHFIIGRKDKLRALGDNTIEYTFISLYSNLLFYFNLSSHHNHNACGTCNAVESALLINCIFISFLVIIHKDFQSETKIPKLIKLVFDWIWLFVMILIFFLIIDINLHLFNFELSANSNDIYKTIYAAGIFFKSPNHFLLLLFMFSVFMITILAWKNQYQKSTFVYQDSLSNKSTTNAESKNEEKIKAYLKIAEKVNANPSIRVQSYYYVAYSHFEKGDFNNALKFIKASKRIALSIPYPEIQLLPIRKLKLKIHLKLNELDKANEEVSEVEGQLFNIPDKQKKTLEFCVTQLKAQINSK